MKRVRLGTASPACQEPAKNLPRTYQEPTKNLPRTYQEPTIDYHRGST
ncbi:MAG: hypothetical protein J6V98_02045 [Bacteroidales bacterium]|nr:hypothetical protein [Bacteroidales bacterium]